MGERVLTVTEAVLEAVRGTPVTPPTRRVYGTTDLTKVQPLVLRDEQVGQFSQLVGPESAVLGSIEAGGTHTEDVTYEDLPWWALLGLKGGVAGVVSAVTAITRTFNPSETVDDIKTATFYQNDETQGWRMPFGMVEEIELSGAVGQPWQMRCALIGATLDPVATPADPGARVGRETIRMGNTKLYVGAAGADPAAQVLGTFIDFRLLIKNNIVRKFFGDGTDQMGSVGREHRVVECDFTFEETAAALTERTNWGTNVPRVVAIEAQGSPIAGSTGPVNRKARLIIPGMWDGWTLGNRVSNRIFTMKLRGLYDIALGKGVSIVSVTGVPDPLP